MLKFYTMRMRTITFCALGQAAQCPGIQKSVTQYGLSRGSGELMLNANKEKYKCAELNVISQN